MTKKKRTGHSGPRPAFLNSKEIAELAERLGVRPGVVATVLQVAGHALRERYRKRGWVEAKREKPPKGFCDQNPPGSGRIDVAAVLAELTANHVIDMVEGLSHSSTGQGILRDAFSAAEQPKHIV